MNTQMIFLGAVLATLFVAFAEWRGGRSTARIHGGGLVVATAMYVFFAASGGGSDWVLTELGGTLVFAALAVGGMRRYPILLALGWLLHVGWDALPHGDLVAGFVPAWYLPLCVGFDLVAAGAILAANLPFRERG